MSSLFAFLLHLLLLLLEHFHEPYSSIVMIALYLAVQKMLYYVMTHVFLYLHPKSGIQIVPILIMILVNLAICAAAVVISGQSVLKEQVVDVIRE